MMATSELTPVLRYASRFPFRTSLAGSLLLWLCLPPVGWWPLAWIALVPWIALILTPRFEAARPLRSIWGSSLVFWAAEVYYISIPHPLLWIAWILLFVYLSVYPVLFVWIGRKLVHGQRVPVLLAAPLVFTALEWVRAHMITGFGFSMLANSQFQCPLILQVCDIAGGYGLTFLMVLFASGCGLVVMGRRPLTGALTSVLTLALVLGYGVFRMQHIQASEGKSLAVAVLQGNIDTRFPATREEQDAYDRQRVEDYLNLHLAWLSGRAEDRRLPDLVIWPEGKYPVTDALPGGGDSSREMRQAFAFFHELLSRPLPPGQTLPPMIAGTMSLDPVGGNQYNSALLLDGKGRVRNRYFKMHRVVFGEYVPFGTWFPALAEMTPIGPGLTAGEQPVGFRVGSLIAAVNICFESAVSHLVRESATRLRSQGEDPDFIVNITDDGWFYGQAVLDHHLACNVMRAVENRKPVIVAANTGLSAIIQGTGEILQQGPRRQSEILELKFELKSQPCLYAVIGDWPVMAMALICVLAIVVPPRSGGGKKTQEQLHGEEAGGNEADG